MYCVFDDGSHSPFLPPGWIFFKDVVSNFSGVSVTAQLSVRAEICSSCAQLTNMWKRHWHQCNMGVMHRHVYQVYELLQVHERRHNSWLARSHKIDGVKNYLEPGTWLTRLGFISVHLHFPLQFSRLTATYTERHNQTPRNWDLCNKILPCRPKLPITTTD